MKREQWLKERGNKIGGSDIPTIMGINKWKSPYQLWLEKTGRAEPQPENNILLEGRFLEDGIFKWFMYLHGDLYKHIETPHNGMLQHPDYDFLIGTPDRIVVNKESGKPVVMEIKHTAISFDMDVIPLPYIVQALYYTGLMGYESFLLLIHNVYRRDIDFVELPFDKDIYQKIIKISVDWYNKHIVNAIPPEATTSIDISLIYPDSDNEKSIEATPDIDNTYMRMIDIKRQLKPLNQEYKLLSERVKLFMGDAAYVVDNEGSRLFSWKRKEGKGRFTIKELFD